jgi:thioredoxin-like negative regulator of GroEL
MASPNREELLGMAIQSARNGNKQGARVMLRQVLNQDPKNERAMLWMAKTANSKTERQQWLERVLTVNPENTTAQKALNQMAHKQEASENRKLFVFGGAVAGALMLISLVAAAAWAFAPLS